jgi:hypothetical protein
LQVGRGKNRRRLDNKIDVGIQTENDIVTDESPDFQVSKMSELFSYNYLPLQGQIKNSYSMK